jgi:antitoxin VapB
MNPTNNKPRTATSASSASEPKTAKLFKNGRSQAVRLPKEFRFEGSEVLVRRDPATGEVILAPAPVEPLRLEWAERFAVWDALGSPDEDALERDQTPPVERDFF